MDNLLDFIKPTSDWGKVGPALAKFVYYEMEYAIVKALGADVFLRVNDGHRYHDWENLPSPAQDGASYADLKAWRSEWGDWRCYANAEDIKHWWSSLNLTQALSDGAELIVYRCSNAERIRHLGIQSVADPDSMVPVAQVCLDDEGIFVIRPLQ